MLTDAEKWSVHGHLLHFLENRAEIDRKSAVDRCVPMDRSIYPARNSKTSSDDQKGLWKKNLGRNIQSSENGQMDSDRDSIQPRFEKHPGLFVHSDKDLL